MIIDTIENADKYYSVHPLFEQAFNYIHSTDLLNAEIGKFQVSEGLLALYTDNPGKTKEQSLEKFECHNKNIDIQVCIRGHETIGWKPRANCTNPKGEYSQEKDVLFYDCSPDMYFQLQDGQFAIFFPEDVHAPMIGNDMIKKLVMKVKI